MNLWRILVISSLIFAVTSTVYAKIYVYEVVTKTRRFQTASKLQPKAFLEYYGGTDIIYKLTVVATLKGDNLEKAAKKFKLGKENYRDLNPQSAKPDYNFNRFIWWR